MENTQSFEAHSARNFLVGVVWSTDARTRQRRAGERFPRYGPCSPNPQPLFHRRFPVSEASARGKLSSSFSVMMQTERRFIGRMENKGVLRQVSHELPHTQRRGQLAVWALLRREGETDNAVADAELRPILQHRGAHPFLSSKNVPFGRVKSFRLA